MKTDFTCGFIGLGLIGGSIARALRQAHPSCRILAYDPDEASLSMAKRDSVVDFSLSDLDERLSSCDYLFLCAPVSENNSLLLKIKKYLSPSCLLTDVGSVKMPIHNQIRQAALPCPFIGGHPMAGSERTGYVNSKALLLQNAYYILTPEEDTDGDIISDFRE